MIQTYFLVIIILKLINNNNFYINLYLFLNRQNIPKYAKYTTFHILVRQIYNKD